LITERIREVNMIAFLQLIYIKLLSIRVDWLREYAIMKYGPRAEVCVVTTAGKGFLHFQTRITEGVIPATNASQIRELIGQNILMVYGPPLESQLPPHVLLLTSWSAKRQLGWKYFKFAKDWPGQSEANGLTVVTYSKR
jgi:hypothetical protein